MMYSRRLLFLEWNCIALLFYDMKNDLHQVFGIKGWSNQIFYRLYAPKAIFKTHGIIAVNVTRKVVDGWIVGRNWWSNSCTNPPVLDVDAFDGIFNRIDAILSAILYSAQKFGAQYAWQRPRLNGKRRDKTWNCKKKLWKYSTKNQFQGVYLWNVIVERTERQKCNSNRYDSQFH